MKATVLWGTSVLLTVVMTCPAFGQVVWCAPALRRPLGVAPSTYGPGFYVRNYLGTVYGPSYYLRPSFRPEGGLRPGQPIYPASLVRNTGQPYPGPMPNPRAYGHPPNAANPYAQGYGYGQNSNGIAAPGYPSYPARPPYSPYAGVPHPPQTPGLPTPPTLPTYPSPPNPPSRHGQLGKRGPGATVVFPSHRFARSPRDFFMWSEGYEDPLNRVRLPLIMP